MYITCLSILNIKGDISILVRPWLILSRPPYDTEAYGAEGRGDTFCLIISLILEQSAYSKPVSWSLCCQETHSRERYFQTMIFYMFRGCHIVFDCNRNCHFFSFSDTFLAFLRK